MHQELQVDVEKELEAKTGNERYSWAVENGIKPGTKSTKKAKTDDDAADPEAAAAKKLRKWCGLSANVSTMAARFVARRVAQDLREGTGVDRTDSETLKNIRGLEWKTDSQRDEVRELILNDAPKLPKTHKLQVVCTDGVSVHLTYAVAGKPQNGDDDYGPDDDDVKPADLPTYQVPVDKLTKDSGVRYRGDVRPTKQIQEYRFITCDNGVREEVFVAAPPSSWSRLSVQHGSSRSTRTFLRPTTLPKFAGIGSWPRPCLR